MKSCKGSVYAGRPIGLAGGLNLYGFANGDPVNFSDPFGLCPPCGSDMEEAMLGVGRRLQPVQPVLETAANLAMFPLLGVESGTARAVPVVANGKLGRLVGDMFKGAFSRNPIGTGSTADIIRHEVATGVPYINKGFHFQKGQDLINGFDKFLSRTGSGWSYDELVARSLRNDLKEALSRVPKNNP